MKSMKVFLSACAVYAIVAACSAMDPHRGDGGSNGVAGNGPTGSGAAAGTGGRSGSTSSIMDPVPPASADPTNGSRLKAKYWQGDDGSKQYISGQWHDELLDIDCSVGLIGDSYRCVPTSGAAGPGEYHADPTCNTPVHIAWACHDLPIKYVLSPTIATGTCSAPSSYFHIYELGTPVPGPLYLKYGTDQCRLFPYTGHDAYTVGPEVPPSAFVLMSVHVDT